MINLRIRPKALLITIPLLTLMASDFANAEIYKWRDNRGVTQYSDRPPVASFSKLTPNEMVNALQTKDLCTVGPIKKSIASGDVSSKDYSSFFSGLGINPGKMFNTGNVNISGISNAIASTNKASTRVTSSTDTNTNAPRSISIASTSVAKNNRVASASTAFNAPAPVTNQYSPLNIKSHFNFGGSKVSVLGLSSSNTPKSTTSPVSTPVATASTALLKPAPVSTPPASTAFASTPPVQVATAEPTTAPSTSPNIVQSALMPAVDISKNMTPVLGWSDLRIRPNNGPQDVPSTGDGNGQFRIDCDVSHMSNDDPILYPYQQGRAHHHTFFGNTSVDYKSDPKTLSTTGNSTCRGGIANRSAYWVPSMIDTATNTPLKPYAALWYYKTGYVVAKEKITAPPKGLRMISGNMKATSEATTLNVLYNCFLEGQPSTASKTIPACKQGWTIVTHVYFPQCWDGKNLDSQDHVSHMANSSNGGCPATHPVAIPAISLNTKYLVTSTQGTKNWRLSSDNYPVNGNNAGYSGHGDWINGWDETVIAGIVKNCLQAGKECGSHKLGDGNVIYGLNRDF